MVADGINGNRGTITLGQTDQFKLHVAVTASIANEQEVTALLSDKDFFGNPKELGEVVGLDWEASAAHALAS